MLRKPVYLGEQDLKAVEIIVQRGDADSLSGAIRIALRRFVSATMILPVATPMTPPSL